MFKGTLAGKEVITSDAAFGAHAIINRIRSSAQGENTREIQNAL